MITAEFFDRQGRPIIPLNQDCWVYFRETKKIQKDYVRSYLTEMFHVAEENKNYLIFKAYTLQSVNSSNLIGEWYPEDVFTTEEETKRQTVFTEMKFSEKEWLTAIGLNKLSEGMHGFVTDDCELEPCCNTISEIREILHTACKNDGLIHQEIERLKDCLTKHEVDIAQMPTLDKILKSIGLEWDKITEYKT